MAGTSFRELFHRFFGTLERLGAPYAAYGGVAVSLWGDPRETQDVDAVITVDDSDCASIVEALEAEGFGWPSGEATTLTIDGWIRGLLGDRYADLALARTPFDRSALTRRRRATVLGKEIWVVTAEDLVLYKLTAFRLKDLVDVEGILLRQGKALDEVYVRQWADEIARHTGKFEVPGKLAELLARRELA